MSSSKCSYLLTPVLKLGDSYLAKLKTFEEWKVNKKDLILFHFGRQEEMGIFYLPNPQNNLGQNRIFQSSQLW